MLYEVLLYLKSPLFCTSCLRDYKKETNPFKNKSLFTVTQRGVFLPRFQFVSIETLDSSTIKVLFCNLLTVLKLLSFLLIIDKL